MKRAEGSLRHLAAYSHEVQRYLSCWAGASQAYGVAFLRCSVMVASIYVTFHSMTGRVKDTETGGAIENWPDNLRDGDASEFAAYSMADVLRLDGKPAPPPDPLKGTELDGRRTSYRAKLAAELMNAEKDKPAER